MRCSKTASVITVLGGVCIFLAVAQGQTRRRPPQPNNAPAQKSAPARSVTITTKKGDKLTGNFVQANGDEVRIEVAGGSRNISLDDVASIVFNGQSAAETTPANQSGMLSPQAKVAANDALKALRKMASATEIGINFQEYGTRAIDAKADVDEALRQLPDGELKTEIGLAIEAYADAGRAWNKMLRYDFMLVEEEPTFPEKYSIPTTRSETSPTHSFMNGRDAILSAIWKAARSHIDRASSLLNK
jgi:hypothetical protein